MERNPGNLTESESHGLEHSGSSDKDTVKKKRRHIAGSAVVASTAAEHTTTTQEASEPVKPKELSPLEQALAQLATEARRQKVESSESHVAAQTEHEAAPETDEHTDGTEADEGSTAVTEEQLTSVAESEAYVPLPDYGIGATEFSGGEVVIDLGGSNVEEHVLPLEPSEVAAQAAQSEAAFIPGETPPEVIRAESEPVAIGADQVSDLYEPTADALPSDPEAQQPISVPAERFSAPVAAAEILHPTPMAEVTPSEVPGFPHQPEAAYSQPQMSMETPMPAAPVAERAPYIPPSRTEQTMSKADFEDAIHRATKAGQNRGVAAGLLVGGGYEHFKHKRREKRAAKKHQETTKKLAEARKTLAFTVEQQSKQRAEYTAQADESQQKLAATERRLGALEQQHQTQTIAESKPAPAAANTHHLKPRAEQMPQPVVETEPLPVAPEHRLQTSSWHSIEVDARTGRAVEKPAFEYGHEYFREQAQENALGQPPSQDSTERRAPAAAHDTPQAPAGFGGSTLPPIYSTPQQPQTPAVQPSQPTQQPKKPQSANVPLATKTLAKPTQSAPPIWPLVLALIVVVVCLSLVLG